LPPCLGKDRLLKLVADAGVTLAQYREHKRRQRSTEVL